MDEEHRESLEEDDDCELEHNEFVSKFQGERAKQSHAEGDRAADGTQQVELVCVLYLLLLRVLVKRKVNCL